MSLNYTKRKTQLYFRPPQNTACLGYKLESTGFEFQQGKENFLFYETSRPAVGSTPPPIQWVPGYFAGGKATGA
jgi:hypothetical protein